MENVSLWKICFNTASGMAQLQRINIAIFIIYQWEECFNTASGMAQLQRLFSSAGTRKDLLLNLNVSIPQAVWPSCNSVLGIPLQDRPKMANWKTSPVFSVIASNFGEQKFFFMTFIHFYTSIYAGFRVHEKIGKPHFRLSFIIAGFQ